MRQGSPPTAIELGPVGARCTASAIEGAAVDDLSFMLRELAVAESGRATRRTPVASDGWPGGWTSRDLPLLSHAGPSLMRWSSQRGMGPEDVPTPFGGRRAAPLDNAGWSVVHDQFAHAASVCADRGAHTVVVDAGSDTLLGASLSPRYAPSWPSGRGRELVSSIVARVSSAVEQVGVLLVVEECAPGGLDPTGGIEAAQAAVASGAAFLISDARSAWFAMRGAGQSALQAVASASWWAPRVAVPVFAQVPSGAAAGAGLANVLARAKASGLDGVVLVETEALA